MTLEVFRVTNASIFFILSMSLLDVIFRDINPGNLIYMIVYFGCYVYIANLVDSVFYMSVKVLAGGLFLFLLSLSILYPAIQFYFFDKLEINMLLIELAIGTGVTYPV